MTCILVSSLSSLLILLPLGSSSGTSNAPQSHRRVTRHPQDTPQPPPTSSLMLSESDDEHLKKDPPRARGKY